MEKLPPIPIPMEQRWRQFRMGAVPVLMFLLVAASVLVLWRQHVVPPHIVGEVEGTWASITSPQTGALAGLAVDRFHRVSAGEPIAHIVTTAPDVVKASLDVIRAEVELIQAQMRQTEQRMLVDYERLRLNWMLERIDLATARVQLQQAESEFHRVSKMFKDQIVPEGGLEKARRDHDFLVMHIAMKEDMVSELEESITSVNSPGINNPLSAALAVQEHKLRLTEAELAPVTLHAPMDGLVSFVHRRPGETVMAGEPILTLSYLHADRIVGYIRQPLNVEPRPGMEVVVRSRSGKRASAVSKVLEVGTQMETIKPALLPTTFFAREETGLPILVALPPELNLIPGETVELVLRSSRSFRPWARSE